MRVWLNGELLDDPTTPAVTVADHGFTVGDGVFEAVKVIGRTPFAQITAGQTPERYGRDHNPWGFTMWMAGGGVKGGQTIGSTDDFGYKAQEQPISYHDLHATMLHLLGLYHTKLTYRFNGRDMRLTDVYGSLIPQIANA